jgi:uncharacterized membrane protein YfcA
MESGMDRMIRLTETMVFAALLIFACLALLPNAIAGLAVVVTTVPLVYWLQIRNRKRGTIVFDERRNAIRNQATRLSWLFTVVLVAVTYILTYLDWIHPSFAALAVMVVGFMIASELFIETYYYRRAEP